MGNISLLLDYAQTVNVVSISNSGIFTPLLQSGSLPSFTGQQVSVFSIGTPCKVSSEHLKYPLKDTVLNSWWMGTLNEALTDTFSLNFSDGKLVVFQKFA
jgi:thiamine pyrophosphokinase